LRDSEKALENNTTLDVTVLRLKVWDNALVSEVIRCAREFISIACETNLPVDITLSRLDVKVR